MNCKQFESRVQQLLDERASLSLDLQIQQHARDCMDCSSALNVYQCFGTAPVEGSSGPSPVVSVASTSDETAWKKAQREQGRRRIVLAAAALLLISAILVTRPNDISSPAVALNSAESQVDNAAVLSPNEVVSAPVGFLLTDLLPDFSGAWPTGSWADSSSYVDLSSIGRIDLTYLIPRESARVVQSIPTTIEKIEPIYRYSTDLPVVKQWSSGINYTIGLIQNSLPLPAAPPETGDDLGNKMHTVNLDLC